MEKSVFATRLEKIMGTKDKFETYKGKTKRIKKYTQQDLANDLGYSVDTVKSWNKSNGTFPTLETIKRISELFNVNTAYLLGEQDCKRHEEQTICDVTMLNEQSASVLTKLSEFEFEVLNNLLTHPSFNAWLFSIYDFTHSHNKRTSTTDTGVMFGGEKMETHSFAKNALKYKASDLFGNMLEDIYTQNEIEENKKRAWTWFIELIYIINEVKDYVSNNDTEYQRLLVQISETLKKLNVLTNNQEKLYQYPPEFYIENLKYLSELDK